MPIDAFSVLCAQLTRDLLAIAKFLYDVVNTVTILLSTFVYKRDRLLYY